MPKKPTQAKDENEIAFGGLQELLKRDEERDKSKQKALTPKPKTRRTKEGQAQQSKSK